MTTVWITTSDGVRLSADLFMPPGDGPFPALIEALPYRKDDSLRERAGYMRLAAAGFAVCRLDVRGTGSSSSDATDEYRQTDIDDLSEVIARLASQPWCNGRVGIFGHGYGGSNSLQVACARPPALMAVLAVNASDDLYSDDVHYRGGALRAIDQVGYCHRMTAMNMLPPVPAVFGDGWREEWLRRLDTNRPWILRWLHEQTDGPYWRRGSLRPAYERISCPTMLVGGWADGQGNSSLRMFEALECDKALLMGPWRDLSRAGSLPGPHVDLVDELIGWFGRWLTDDDSGTGSSAPIRVFVREPTPPEPDLATHDGYWRAEESWPSPRADEMTLRPAPPDVIDHLDVRFDVGTAGPIACAGGFLSGQPLDQREDDSWSLMYDWHLGDEDIAIVGHPVLRVRVGADRPVASLSAKLCSVFPDGTSCLVSRGFLNLTHRRSSTVPTPLVPGEFVDIELVLDATAWHFPEGHTIRLSLAGADWPNTWVPPQHVRLSIERSSLQLQLPVVYRSHLPEPRFSADRQDALAEIPRAPDADQIDAGRADADRHRPLWRVSRDIVERTTTVTTKSFSAGDGPHNGRFSGTFEGEIGISQRYPGDAWATASARFEDVWPDFDIAVRVEARMMLRSDETDYHVDIDVDADENGKEVARLHWSESIPRHLA